MRTVDAVSDNKISTTAGQTVWIKWVQEATLNTNCLPHENDICEPNRAERQSLLKAFSQVLSLCCFLLDAHGKMLLVMSNSSNWLGGRVILNHVCDLLSYLFYLINPECCWTREQISHRMDELKELAGGSLMKQGYLGWGNVISSKWKLF